MKSDSKQILERASRAAELLSEDLQLAESRSQLEHDVIVAHLLKFRDSEMSTVTTGIYYNTSEWIHKDYCCFQEGNNMACTCDPEPRRKNEKNY